MARRGGMFETFLRAQETSPTVTLSDTEIGDEGTLQVSSFLASHEHIRHLDLGGNGISSTGLLHLAKALKANKTLESLVLRHNRLLEGSEAGMVALCRGLAKNTALRHLDIRQCNLSGDLAARCIGEMLQENSHLTHLELSWNPLMMRGGRILLEHLPMNSTLLDCQLSGCKVDDETLLGIAQRLMRNRQAQGAGMEAGPYKGSWESGSRALELQELVGAVSAKASAQSGLYSVGPALPLNGLVSAHRTQEHVKKLLAWRAAKREEAPADGSTEHSQQFLASLDQLQKELDSQREAGDDVRKRTGLLITGFQEREQRYKADMAAAEAKILQFANEHEELRHGLNSTSEKLRLLREANNDAQRCLTDDRRRYEAEEARAKNDLATVVSDWQELTRVLRSLEVKSAQKEEENNRLRARAQLLRADVDVAGKG